MSWHHHHSLAIALSMALGCVLSAGAHRSAAAGPMDRNPGVCALSAADAGHPLGPPQSLRPCSQAHGLLAPDRRPATACRRDCGGPSGNGSHRLFTSPAGRPATAAPFPYRISGVTQVAQLIGPTPGSPYAAGAASPHSINDTMRWGICGGDLGSLMDDRGTAYITLGDNYTSCPPGTGGPGGGLQPPDWRSNAVGVIPAPADFTHGLRIARWISGDGRRAMEVIPSAHNVGDCEDTQAVGCEVTRIPTYGFAVQGRLFLAYMSVHHWGDPGMWDVNYSGFALSANQGRSWTVETRAATWGPRSNFAQVAVTPDPSGRYLLFYGIPGGRFGSVRLMRTPATWRDVLTARSYQYDMGTDANGGPRWSADAARAVVVADAPVGELSVIYDAGLKEWLMTYLQGNGDIVIRGASHYWGPWSSPVTLATQAQFPGLYGAFMEHHFLTDNGHTVYFVMSQWNPYAVFWMKATLTRES